ncbi:hypothetical protein Tco_0020120 [Tanacetum coccineum]
MTPLYEVTAIFRHNKISTLEILKAVSVDTLAKPSLPVFLQLASECRILYYLSSVVTWIISSPVSCNIHQLGPANSDTALSTNKVPPMVQPVIRAIRDGKIWMKVITNDLTGVGLILPSGLRGISYNIWLSRIGLHQEIVSIYGIYLANGNEGQGSIPRKTYGEFTESTGISSSYDMRHSVGVYRKSPPTNDDVETTEFDWHKINFERLANLRRYSWSVSSSRLSKILLYDHPAIFPRPVSFSLLCAHAGRGESSSRSESQED